MLLWSLVLLHANQFSKTTVEETVEGTAINYERLLNFEGHAKVYLITNSMLKKVAMK